MSPAVVRLEPLTDVLLPGLLAAAVADADPVEVMPPVDGPPGWTTERRSAFLDFHRRRSVHAAAPVETTYVVTVDGRPAGAARLEPTTHGAEVGIWLGRSTRGRGVGTQVLAELIALARRSRVSRLLASTTTDNIAAQRLLIDVGSTRRTRGDTVEFSLEL